MPNNVQTGFAGQRLAERHYLDKGCTILETNFRSHFGEIDLIVKDGCYIVFVEVKCRKTKVYGLPREAVGRRKQHRIRTVALSYIAMRQLGQQDFRFDVAEVLYINGTYDLTLIENAF